MKLSSIWHHFTLYWGISTSEPKFGYLHASFPYKTDEVIPLIVHLSNYLPGMTPVCLVLQGATTYTGLQSVLTCITVSSNRLSSLIIMLDRIIQTRTIAMLMIAIATVGVTTSTMSSAIPVHALSAPPLESGHTTCTSSSTTCTSSGNFGTNGAGQTGNVDSGIA